MRSPAHGGEFRQAAGAAAAGGQVGLKRLGARVRGQVRVCHFTLTTAVSLSCSARSDRKGPVDQCPMLEVERKSRGHGAKSVFDPTRTWSVHRSSRQ